MCEKYFEGSVPGLAKDFLSKLGKEHPFAVKTSALLDNVHRLTADLEPLMDRVAFSEALERIWGVIDLGNKYIESAAPWKMWKENKTDEVKVLIAVLCQSLQAISVAVSPFMPTVAELMKVQLGAGGPKVSKGEPIFPRIEIK